MLSNLEIEQTLFYPDLIDNSAKTTTKLCDVHAGDNYVCFHGKLTIGFDLGVFIINWLLTNMSFGFFCWTTIRNMKHKEVIVTFAIIICVLTNIFLFLSATVNPGIIKRFPIRKILSSTSKENKKKIKTKRIVNYKGANLCSKLCETCGIYRPLRASHCKKCDNCIMKFDHHCPWVGSDVGLRNYRFFYLYLWSVFISTVYLITFSILTIKYQYSTISNSDDKTPSLDKFTGIFSGLVIILISLPVCLLIINLLIFHTKLISINQTSREYIKNFYDGIDNPFDNGFKKNWKEVFFTPIPKLHFRYTDKITQFELIDLEDTRKRKMKRKKLGLKKEKDFSFLNHQNGSTKKKKRKKERKRKRNKMKNYENISNNNNNSSRTSETDLDTSNTKTDDDFTNEKDNINGIPLNNYQSDVEEQNEDGLFNLPFHSSTFQDKNDEKTIMDQNLLKPKFITSSSTTDTSNSD
ncbi:s-acyltransferase [Anaeramoeba flamelloides]|uniref:Palmitoyltransferase n=1 Tax=Anaeramoeba flamelloides TaxID=1746091 RepID=A0AAV7YY21_9EUKA|nr:s-acyltransferase [Anaeramoeba flamelloides]